MINMWVSVKKPLYSLLKKFKNIDYWEQKRLLFMIYKICKSIIYINNPKMKSWNWTFDGSQNIHEIV